MCLYISIFNFAAHSGPPRCTKCNSPPTNGQCTDHRIAVQWSLLCGFNVSSKGLKQQAAASARSNSPSITTVVNTVEQKNF